MATTLASGFLDRTTEREMLDRLLAQVREGESAVLVIRGEAGIGKTALLRYVADHASGFRVVQVTGAEAEMELPFAGTHQLCAPLLDQLDALPQPQRDALNVALGLASGDVPERFLVGLAVLGLLSASAEERPLLCLVEDAQWLDAASGMVLGFVARRLLAESVAFVVAVREPTARHDFDGLPELLLQGLRRGGCAHPAAASRPGSARRPRPRPHRRGDPRQPARAARSAAEHERGGARRRLRAPPLRPTFRATSRITTSGAPASCPRRPSDCCCWSPPSRWVTRRSSGAPPTRSASNRARSPRQRTRSWSRSEPRARFRHPLVRSAIYRAAAPSERRAAHRALADATDPDTDPDRLAWHRAQAAVGVDEEVAAELERSADRAQARGGAAAAAAFLAHAAELTPDPAERGQAGPRRRAGEVRCRGVGRGARAAGDRRARPRSTSFSAPGWSGCAPRSRSPARAAATLRPCCSMPPGASSRSTPRWLARRISRRSAAAMFAGRLGGEPDVREAAEAAQAAPPAPQPPRAIDLLLDGLATRYTEGYAAGLPPLRKALGAFRDVDELTAPEVRWLWLACRLAQDLWDDELWHDARDPRGARRARQRRAHPAPGHGQLPRCVQRPLRGLRQRRGADRRGRCDHAGDRHPAAQATRR